MLLEQQDRQDPQELQAPQELGAESESQVTLDGLDTKDSPVKGQGLQEPEAHQASSLEVAPRVRLATTEQPACLGSLELLVAEDRLAAQGSPDYREPREHKESRAEPEHKDQGRLYQERKD